MSNDTIVMANDTIAAVSTPPGRGGIGIVRFSGPAACAIAGPLLKLRHPLAHARARFAEIIHTATGDVLDQALVTFFAAPKSYTGEDVVEIAAHGSPVLLDYLLRQSVAAGARLAEPGEFTQRAFLSGRLDLTQAEAVGDLIDASTLHQARIAARQLGGSLSGEVAPIKQALIALIAALEAGIDFAEDDIDLLPKEQIGAQIDAIRVPLSALEQTFPYGRVVRSGFTLAIVGRPNAGKSSLFNCLVERQRAIVTAAPGTTRDLVTERVSFQGIPVDLIDTAGLRHRTEDSLPLLDEAESIGIVKSREAMAEADIVLLVLDATAPLDPDDEAIMTALAARPLLIVLNKCDLSSGTPLAKAVRDASTRRDGAASEPAPAASESIPATGEPAHANEEPVQRMASVETSALTGAGIPQLRAAIMERITSTAPTADTALLTNLRQQQAVSRALAALIRADTARATTIPHEMILLDLYEALSALDDLTGATNSGDILNMIFSRFCIGK